MARVIAFFLPQFHAIPENDRWWGKGFTEWTNVRPARPLFPGHHQPHVPADLGWYDLADPHVLPRIEGLVDRYGLTGLCWYHYWFDGTELLERPLADKLSRHDAELPFCLCWANEPWSRRWDGSDHDVLQPQGYSDEDDANHFDALLPALTDPRAIRVENRPIFLVYRCTDLPDPPATTARWRAAAVAAGLPGLHLVAVESGPTTGVDPRPLGFDATVRFQPDWTALGRLPERQVGPPTARVYDYRTAWRELQRCEPVPWIRYPSVCPGWDNTARRGESATVLHPMTPRHYEHWLGRAVSEADRLPPEHRLVFVNAWNEWGEGCHLEPDRRHGHAYLRATRRALHTDHADSEDSDARV